MIYIYSAYKQGVSSAIFRLDLGVRMKFSVKWRNQYNLACITMTMASAMIIIMTMTMTMTTAMTMIVIIGTLMMYAIIMTMTTIITVTILLSEHLDLAAIVSRKAEGKRGR